MPEMAAFETSSRISRPSPVSAWRVSMGSPSETMAARCRLSRSPYSFVSFSDSARTSCVKSSPSRPETSFNLVRTSESRSAIFCVVVNSYSLRPLALLLRW